MEKEYAVQLLQEKKFAQLKKELQEMNPADIASLVEEMDEVDEFGERELTLLYRILPKEMAADVFTYMDSGMQKVLINAFSDKELRDVIDELYIDDTVDIIEEMPANVVSRILKNTDADTRKQINQLLNYPKDSAGSVMTTEFVYLKKDSTVKEAFDQIRRIGLVKETVYTCYVTENRRLLGVVTVLDMLVADYETHIEDIMETNVISVNTHDDQETAAQMLSKYDLAAIPVVDGDNRLVGIVTFDDAMDVIRDEDTEDIEKMAAMLPSDRPYMKQSILQIWKQRIPWLILLMVSATFTGMILSKFEDALSVVPALTIFIPMLMDTGGNSGTEASTMVIRGLALDEIEPRDAAKVWFKEIRVALLVSAGLALINFARIAIQYHDVAVAAIVSLTLIATVCIAKSLGCLLPMLAKKLKLDPALMATPILTTVTDAASILVYFTLTMNILGDRL